MNKDIRDIITITLKLEGGLSDNENDKGGLTKFGISQSSYPNLNVRDLTLEQAYTIYERDFYIKNKIFEINSFAMRAFLFDTSVHSGPVAAVKILQSAYNHYRGKDILAVDGVLGYGTISSINAIRSKDDVYDLFFSACIVRAMFLKGVSLNGNNKVFLSGWTNRLIKLRRLVFAAIDSQE